ncbi:hypothetical protein [Neisseria polysaccharea]|uniref:hypothetical protein n=1 Tax=Neisseria polysaccharea TaxID=489 RepID=UPI00272BEFC4|nr:hypothetical protein [Neisseria polysaccharea]
MPSEAGFPAFRRHLKLQNPIHRATLYVPSCVLKHRLNIVYKNADAPRRIQTASQGSECRLNAFAAGSQSCPAPNPPYPLGNASSSSDFNHASFSPILISSPRGTGW